MHISSERLPVTNTSLRGHARVVMTLVAVLAMPALVVTAPASNAATRPKAPTRSTAPTPGSSATSSLGCGGEAMATSTGGLWQCTFDDEFSSGALDTTKWVAQQTSLSGYHSGQECFVNSPNNVKVANGVLSLTVRREAVPFTCSDPFGNYTTQYTSGMVSTYGLFTQTYGRFEVRAKLPAAAIAGLQESFWLWPANPTNYGLGWPSSGEIDFAEIFSLYPDRAIPYIHYNAATYDANVTNDYCMISDISQFHTYAVEWTPTAITIIYDGRTCLIDRWNPAWPLAKPQPFDQPFLLVLTQALGIGSNSFDAATTPLPATTQIDYARIWK